MPNPGRLGDRFSLRSCYRGACELARPCVDYSLRNQPHRHPGQRSRIAGELQLTGVDRVPALVIPQHVRRNRRQPGPSKPVLGRIVCRGEGLRCTPQCWRRCVASLGDQQRERVQEQIRRMRSMCQAPEPLGRHGRPRADRPQRPDARRTSPLPKHPGRSLAPAPDRASPAVWRRLPAAAARRFRYSRRTRSAHAAAPSGHAGARPAIPPPRSTASSARCRTCRHRDSPGRRQAPGPPSAWDHRSRRRTAAEMPPLRPAHRAPAPGLRSARAPTRSPHRVQSSPRQGARHGGPDRSGDRSHPRAPDAPPGVPPLPPTGTPPSEPADGGT